MIKPTAGRVTTGFAVAVMAASAPTLVFGLAAIFVFPIAMMIAAVHAALLALPLYLLLRRRAALTLVRSAVGGFVAGALPSALLAGAKVGEFGLYPWLLPFLAGCCGLLGGMTFWIVIQAPGRDHANDA